MGFLSGLFGTDPTKQMQQNGMPIAPGYMSANSGDPAFNQRFITQADQANQNQAGDYAQQQALAQQLMAQASGQNTGLAGALLNQAQGNQAAQTNGLIASHSGGMNPALAMRQAMNMNANAGQQTAQQAGIMGMQQQQGAQGLLAQQLAQMRGQNQQQAATNNQGLLTTAQNNMSGYLDSQRMNEDLAKGTANANAAAVSGAGQAIMGGAQMMAGKPPGKAHGGQIAGKAQVSGDSPKNDTVPTMLSPGEIVIPRSAASDPEKAKEFVEQIMKKKGEGSGSYGKVIAAHKKLGEHLEALKRGKK